MCIYLVLDPPCHVLGGSFISFCKPSDFRFSRGCIGAFDLPASKEKRHSRISPKLCRVFQRIKIPCLPSLRCTHLSHTKFFFNDLTWYDFHKNYSDDYRIYRIMISVPITIRRSPVVDFFVSFSLNTKKENAIVTRMLSLSIGTTTLAGPSCNAL